MRSAKRCPRLRRKVSVMRRRESPVAVTTSTGRRLRQLQRMLPTAASETNADTLFQRTADYIFLLQAKLSLLHTLSALYGV
ncbi:hypothetical protein V6N13_058323 [Hibiscus sabdariffa]|uniref:BHLH domain-containing protein n=1 Tax=Hibiscus sabdariffa TaxID=183260 RepID=A0ABR2GHH6_9ROSI